MRRRIVSLTILILATVALLAPSASPQSACDKADKFCWDNSEFVDATCMIVFEDPIKCSNDAADYYENCMAERNCAPRNH